jgi:hypothetical protein
VETPDIQKRKKGTPIFFEFYFKWPFAVMSDHCIPGRGGVFPKKDFAIFAI